jgi:uncharacterized protein
MLLAALEEECRRLGSVLVSYSGGVDSALLAVIAHHVLGDRMVCAFLDGPLVPRRAASEAKELADRYDLPLVVIPFDPLGDPLIAANPPDRCYHCKKALASLLKQQASSRGFSSIVDGVNCSDLCEHRPGLRACAEEGIVHPYMVAGCAKSDIRRIARSMGLAFAEKPSGACLASRVPYGTPLDPTLLARVESAEDEIGRLGFPHARVRVHGRLARIEIAPEAFEGAVTNAPVLVAALKRLGFTYVTLDLEGYRAGAMDEVLGDRGQ